jgi:hypothetical protein
MSQRGKPRSRQSPDPETEPPLFALPERMELVEMASAPVGHTGRWTLKDQELVNEVAGQLAQGRAIRAISRSIGIGRETVKALRRHLETTGKLGPWKERMVRKYEDIAVDCADEFHERVLDGECTPTELSVGGAVAIDKRQVLVGGPTSIVLHQERAVTPEELAGRLDEIIRQLPSAAQPIEVSTESKSVADGSPMPEPQEVATP